MQRTAQHRQVASPQSVYIHIPFCTNKCYYCDFNSYLLKGQPVMDYLHALEREMDRTVQINPPTDIRTVFIGGGTPTTLTPKQMEFLLQMVRTYFPYESDNVEFSMEANPGTTDEEKLAVMKAGGVNRISFGVQAFQNELLAGIGRIHQIDDVYQSVQLAKDAGFNQLSIDLMFGLPNQTLSMLDDSITQALKLNLPHYSIYGLKVEENTLFHRLYHQDHLPLPTEEEEFNMYLLLMNRMKEAGYGQYEISNFAKPNDESVHNQTYWRNEAYYGLGAGAHGYVSGTRHLNVKGISAYIESSHKRLPRLQTTNVTVPEAMENFMMLGLRMREGVLHARFEQQFGQSMEQTFRQPLLKGVESGLLQRTLDGFCLTDRGILLGNEVFAQFIGVLPAVTKE